MKKMLALLLACLLFAGCAGQQENSGEGVKKEYVPSGGKTSPVTLYYPTADGLRVVPCTQTVIRTTSLYAAVMEALLRDSDSGMKTAFAPGVDCRSVLLVQDILYIDLSWRFREMKSEQMLTAVNMLVTTFTQFPEVNFVNLSVEGEQLTLPEMPRRPYMLFSGYSGTVSDFLTEFAAKRTQYSLDLSAMVDMCYVVTYSQDSSGTYLIPQVSGVTVIGCDYSSALLTALLAGTGSGTRIFADGFTVRQQAVYVAEQHQLTLSLNCPKGWAEPEDWIAPKAIAATLSCVFPELETVTLSVYDGETAVYNRTTAVSGVAGDVRCLVDVYVPDASGSKLTGAKLLTAQMPNSMNLTDFTRQLLVAIRDSFARVDRLVNGVAVNGTTVVIDLNKAVYDAYDGISAQQEYAVVYALVSSVCSYCEAKNAMLLEDGCIRQTFSSSISLSSPLYSLPRAHLQALT